MAPRQPRDSEWEALAESSLPQDVTLDVPLVREVRASPPPPAAEPAPAELEAAPEQRFRIRTQKPTRQAPRRRTSQVRNVTMLAAFPAVFLILYVFFVTAAVKGGYYKSALQNQLENLRIEQADLEADLRRLQAPGVIFSRAEKLGMRTAEEREYVRVPGEARATPETAGGGSRL